MERDVERGAGIRDGPVGPVRCDLDRVALPQAGDERRRERLSAARLGERHDDEQAGSRREEVGAPSPATRWHGEFRLGVHRIPL